MHPVAMCCVMCCHHAHELLPVALLRRINKRRAPLTGQRERGLKFTLRECQIVST
jgi:hypothetical protein